MSPPASLVNDVEQAVMSHVRKHRPAPIFYQRKFIAATMGIAVVLVFVGNLVFRDLASANGARDDTEFVESKIIMDNHVSIWLEPIDAQETQR